MCGIVGFFGKKNAVPIVFEALKNLEYRGYDSWGIGFIKNHRISVFKRVGKLPKSSLNLGLAKIAIGHDRWATHGGVTQINAHPHLDCTGKIGVAHNGIIENFEALKKKLLKLGHKFKSETDTEVFSHLVEEYKKLGFVQACQKAFSEIVGRNAFVVVDADGQTLVGFRNGSPLIFGLGKAEFFLASDIPAFLSHTKDLVFLDDGQGVVLEKLQWKVLDFKKGKILKPKLEKIAWKIGQAKKGKFAHFLIKEILEQPSTVQAACQQNQAEIAKLASMIKKAFGSYLIGCGTASYAALYGTYVFSNFAQKHINFAIGSEFGGYQHFLTPKSLVIAVSQSGETADVLEAVQIAKRRKAQTCAIVNVASSTLARTANFTLLTNAGPEIAVVSTKAFTAQLSVLLLLAYTVARKFSTGKLLIEKTAKALDRMLTSNYCQKIHKLAKKLKLAKHLYVIGKGQNYPIALEAALKIKEASYIHGEGFAAGELKHGVIALIEKGALCLVLFSNDEDKDYILGSAQELKARGGFIVGIGPEDHGVFDEFIKVPNIPQVGAIVNTPPIQLLAYYLAVEKGLDPDKPRNLAKSVTVK